MNDSPSEQVARLYQKVGAAQMEVPVRCLLAAHRPLAFFAGQLLLVLAPIAAILGRRDLAAWALLCAEPPQVGGLAQTPPADVDLQQGDSHHGRL